MHSQDNFIIKLLGYEDITSPEQQYGKQIGIHAPKRKGKTLTLIMILNILLDVVPFIKGVISNLALTLPKQYEHFDIVNLKDIKDIGKDRYRSYIILIDEMGHIVESRMSSSFRNIFVSNILADVGKFKQLLGYTSQQASQIDLRIRDNVDLVLRPIIDFKTGLMRVQYLFNYFDYFTIDSWHQWEYYDEYVFYFPFRQYFDWYDTHAKIEEYVITFTPEDYLKQFLVWWKDMGYHQQQHKITNSTLKLWKEMDGVIITSSQLSALTEYMKRETDLPMYGVKR